MIWILKHSNHQLGSSGKINVSPLFLLQAKGFHDHAKPASKSTGLSLKRKLHAKRERQQQHHQQQQQQQMFQQQQLENAVAAAVQPPLVEHAPEQDPAFDASAASLLSDFSLAREEDEVGHQHHLQFQHQHQPPPPMETEAAAEPKWEDHLNQNGHDMKDYGRLFRNDW